MARAPRAGGIVQGLVASLAVGPFLLLAGACDLPTEEEEERRSRVTSGGAVTNPTDTVAPSILELAFTPRSISLGGERGAVAVEVLAWDNLSGVQEIGVTFEGPKGSGAEVGTRLDLASGNLFRGTYQGEVTISADAPTGDWILASIVAVDRAENRRRLTADTLRARNAPVTLTVR